MNPYLEAALKYAGLGFAVFPLKPGGKDPATQNGFYDATKDPEKIKKLWTPNSMDNIGIATGIVSGGLFVVDVDNKNGHHGEENLRDWEREHGSLPETCQVLTASGGIHLYFRSDTIVTDEEPEIDGIDVRGTGGYVVAPPSKIGGKEYSWEASSCIFDVDIAEANDLVFEFIKPKDNKKEEKETFRVPEKIKSGERTSTLVGLVGSLVAKGLAEESIEAAVRIENTERCDPPLTEDELKREVLPALTRGWIATKPYTQKANQEEIQFPPLTPMSDFEEKSARWLVSQFIPEGDITILAGDGGVGKTFIWCDIAAGISSGKQCFLEHDIPFNYKVGGKNVAVFSSEDSVEMQLHERLRKAGAKLENIYTLPLEDETFGSVNFDSPVIEQYILQCHPALMVFDPIQSFVPPGVKMSQRNEMRAVLNPLISLGKKYGVSFLIIVHTNKMNGVWGRKRIADSSDIWDIARSVLIAGDTGEGDVRYISQEKSNYSAREKTVLFKLSDDGCIKYQGETDKTDYDYVMAQMQMQRASPEKDEAKEEIRDYLKENGKVPSKQLDDAMRAIGISKATLNRAKSELKNDGIIRYESSKKDGKKAWYCCLNE